MTTQPLQVAVIVLMASLGTNGLASAQVKTAGGELKGSTSADGRLHIYKGIPYGAAPIGDLRWKAPKPAPPWKDVRDATEFGPQCMQGSIFGDITFPRPASEDCLNLNVWTPATTASDRLPVMVWIHGGGFQAGAGPEPRHDGEALARKGVVVVTLNYRLGSVRVPRAPGAREVSPAGTRPATTGCSIRSLRSPWVQENIAAFGGDPRNVTIFGESAGSFAVSALMASPLATGSVPQSHRRERRILLGRQRNAGAPVRRGDRAAGREVRGSGRRRVARGASRQAGRGDPAGRAEVPTVVHRRTSTATSFR